MIVKNKVVKERVIFSNYYSSELYDECEQYLRDESEDDEEPSDNAIWEEYNFIMETDWENESEQLKQFFLDESEDWLCIGAVSRWNGIYHGGFVFKTFEEMFRKATEDCDYWKFYDENGHLYLTCSHHDGTCCFEIKKLKPQGRQYLENWEYGSWSDKRTQSDVYKQLTERYSTLPNYAHKKWGCPRVEYEPQSKEAFQRILNNQAKSFYC